MIRKYLVKYIVFLILLLLCIGAAWYCAKKEDAPVQDAVLVYAPREERAAGLVVRWKEENTEPMRHRWKEEHAVELIVKWKEGNQAGVWRI